MKKHKAIGIFVSGVLVGAVLTGLLFNLRQPETHQLASRPEPAKEVVEKVTAQDTEANSPEFARNIDGSCALKGVVLTNEKTPVENVRVGVLLLDQRWSEPQPQPLGMTDENGRFTVKGLDESLPMILYGVKEGLGTASLKNPTCSTEIELVLKERRTVQVRVTDSNNSPVEDAHIVLAGDSLWPPRRAVSRKNGLISIHGLPDGNIQMWSYSGHRVGEGTVSLENADDPKDLSIELAAVAPATITIVDDANRPLSGVPFFVSPEGTPLLKRLMVSNEDGTLTVACPANRCDVEMGPYDALSPPSFTVSNGTEKTIVLSPGIAVAGVVTDEDGRPIEQASLVVLEKLGTEQTATRNERGNQFMSRLVQSAWEGWPKLLETADGQFLVPVRYPIPDFKCDKCERGHISGNAAVTDSAGRFVLRGLPKKELVLSAEHADMVMQGRPITLRLGEQSLLSGVKITMRKGTCATLRVVDSRGIPITGADVVLFDLDKSMLRDGRSDEDGYVSFSGLPGDFRIEATHASYVSRVMKIDGKTGDTLDLTLKLRSAEKQLRGRVKDQHGFGVAGAEVVAKSIERGYPHVLMGTTNHDGTFLLEGAGEGRYCIRADAGDRGSAFVSDFDFHEETKLVLGSGAAVAHDSSSSEAYTIIEPSKMPERIASTITDNLSGDNLGVTSSDSNGIGTGLVKHSSKYGEADALPVTGPSGRKNGGLPIKIGTQGGCVVVTAVKSGSRVEVAGLKKGCKILSIDGRSVRGQKEAKKAMTGPIGSVVMLEVTDPNSDVPYTIVVQRVPARN